MGAGSLSGLAPTTKARHVLEFDFETFEVNIHDTILVPMQVGRHTPLEDMDMMDFGLVRHSDLFPLRYAGVIPMRFLMGWNDDEMYFENWAYSNKPEVVTMEDIYSILAEIDEVGAKACVNRKEHAVFMENMTKMRDFVAYVADQERKAADDTEARDTITTDKGELGIKPK